MLRWRNTELPLLRYLSLHSYGIILECVSLARKNMLQWVTSLFQLFRFMTEYPWFRSSFCSAKYLFWKISKKFTRIHSCLSVFSVRCQVISSYFTFGEMFVSYRNLHLIRGTAINIRHFYLFCVITIIFTISVWWYC